MNATEEKMARSMLAQFNLGDAHLIKAGEIVAAMLQAAGLDPYDVDRLASGDYMMCDGYCNEEF